MIRWPPSSKRKRRTPRPQSGGRETMIGNALESGERYYGLDELAVLGIPLNVLGAETTRNLFKAVAANDLAVMHRQTDAQQDVQVTVIGNVRVIADACMSASTPVACITPGSQTWPKRHSLQRRAP